MEGSAAGGIGLIAKLKVKFGLETSEEEVIKKEMLVKILMI